MAGILPRLWVVGAGGFGREVWAYAREHPDNGRVWQLAGFLDDHVQALQGKKHYPQVHCRIEDFAPGEGDLLVNGIGQIHHKKSCAELLQARGGRFLRLVHPAARISGEISWGKGGVVCPGVVLTTDIQIGDHVVLNCQTAVGHDATVGDYTTISSFCDLTGGVQIGREVFAGSRVTVIPRVRVGDQAVLGAGSVVIGDLAGGHTYFGNPARRLGR